MKRTLFAFTSLVSLFAFPAGVLSDHHKFTVGVLVPDRGSERWIGEQIKAGMQFNKKQQEGDTCSFESDSLVEFVYSEGDLIETSDLKSAYESLLDKGVDVVIGGIVPDHSAVLRDSAVGSGTPVILLSPSDSGLESKSTLGNVLQLGLSEEQVYRASLKTWLENPELEKVSMVYADNKDLTKEYGTNISSEVVKLIESAPVFHKFAYTSTREPDYEDVLKKLERVNPDAIAFATPSLDLKGILYQAVADRVLTSQPLYVSMPVQMINYNPDFEKLAELAYAPVSFGAQFWPDLRNACTGAFVEQVRKQLEWPSTAQPSVVAIKAYDALQVAKQAWQSGSFSGWANLERVDGLTGTLQLEGGEMTMVGPISLVTADPAEGLITKTISKP